MTKTRDITEAGLFSALIAVLIIASFYLPIVGSVMAIFLPLPIIVLTLKNKPVLVIAASFVAIVLSGFFISFFSSITMGGMAFIVGFPMGMAIKHKMSNLLTILVGSAGAAIGFLTIFWLLQYMTGVTLMETVEESFKLSMDIQNNLTSTVAGLGLNSNTSAEEAQKLMDNLLYLMKLIMPALLLVMAMVYSSANLVLSHQILKRLQIEHVPMGTFDQFRYPKHLAYGSIAMIVLAYLVGSFGLVDLQMILANFIYLFTAIFSVQGMSLLYYYAKKKTGRASGFIIILLIAFLGLIQYLAFLGFFDVFMDLRKLETKKADQ